MARAEAGGLTLTSLMARLTVETWAEKMLVPAFIFFFAMLYPFAWVNDPRRKTAAAAGGVILARREALEAAGGVAAIADAIIDDCAMGAIMKRQGPIWLGLTDRARSLRPYTSLGENRPHGLALGLRTVELFAMVADGNDRRHGPGLSRCPGSGGFRRRLGAMGWAAAAWLAMAVSFQPMLRFYRRSPLWGVWLPAIGALYTGFTLWSAIESWRGRGGQWKGRAQAPPPGLSLPLYLGGVPAGPGKGAPAWRLLFSPAGAPSTPSGSPSPNGEENSLFPPPGEGGSGLARTQS